jgi:hypothetical protein
LLVSEKTLDLTSNWYAPYYGSPAWLRIDPTSAALKHNPRFTKMVD